MLPLRDNNPTKNFPVVTLLIIIINVAVFFCTLLLSKNEYQAVVFQYGFAPRELFGATNIAGWALAAEKMVSSMFLHSGFWHLALNMLFLWIFGDNIEDITGPFRFIIFYLICGIAACLLQAAMDINSATPMIGASGAISGVLGGYLVKFPRASILTWLIIFIVRLPAYAVLILWFVIQIFRATQGNHGGVAYLAHIGGFVAGMLLIKLFEKKGRVKRHL